MNISTVSRSTAAIAPSPPAAPLAGTRGVDEANVLEGSSFDSGMESVQIGSGRTLREQEQFDYRVSLEHVENPIQQAAAALNEVESRLTKVEKELKVKHPELAKSSWDFTIKEGKLEVTGSVSKADKKLIESKLNGDGELRSAVNSFVKAVEGYLETSDENPAYSSNNMHTGQIQSYEFHDVLKKLDGNVGFRSLLATSSNSFTKGEGNAGHVVDPKGRRGVYSLEMMAAQLR